MLRFLVALAASCVIAPGWTFAEKNYGPGVTDAEIKIGQTFAYSGPISAYAPMARTEAAYFDKINAEGGVNGRKIRLISLDDAYEPPKTVEQTRRLIESEEVLLLFNPLGAPTVTAIQKYVNARKIPTLFVASGATKFGDHKNSPWTIGWSPSYQIEMRIYAQYIMKNFPGAKVGVLYLNNDAGRDFLEGVHLGFGERVQKSIVAEVSVEPTDPTIDSQVIALRAAGVDVLINTLPTKAAAQAIRKAHDMGWRPIQFISYISNSIATVLQPAGLDKSTGLISAAFFKDPSDPQWLSDGGVLEYLAFMKQHYPRGDPNELYNYWGYSYAQTLAQVLKQCGDNLTRENVMRQAADLKDLGLPMLLPGIKINTGPTDYYPIKQLQMIRFDGAKWVRVGEILGN